MRRTAVRSLAAGALGVVLTCGLGARLYGKDTAAKPNPATNTESEMAGVTPANVGRVDKFWARAQREDYKSPEELLAQNARELRKGQVYAKLMHGDPRVKAVALTFDDGPHPDYTPKLLAILRKYKVKATFFVIGKMVEQYPELVRAEDADGNQIGNHTYHHVNLKYIPLDEIALEWQACNAAVKSVIGKAMKYCRPPGGDYDRDVITAAMDAGLTTVLWTDDPADYAGPGDRVIEERVLDRIGNGGIILLHDGVQQTVDILPQIIQSLQRRGFQFQTAEKMDRGLRSSQRSSSSSTARPSAPK
jgi:peptidoglycan/xylan/chitin deacetylase (PgdA/CDA1 family)